MTLSPGRGQALCFVLTFAAYVALHAERKSYTNVKAAMLTEWGFSQSLLGVLDTIFMLTYAIGLYASGVAGDSTSPKSVLLSGLSASTFVVVSLGYANNLVPRTPIYLGLMAVNGLVQSTVWPNAVSIMASWFPGANRGFILGLWSVNANVGNLTGGIFNSVSESMGASISTTLLIPCVFTAVVVIAIYFHLEPQPRVVIPGGTGPDEEHQSLVTDDSGLDKKRGIGFVKSLMIPGTSTHVHHSRYALQLDVGVLEYSLAYACIKNVNYSAMFWMSFYLNQQLKFSDAESAQLSVWYDVGCILGGILIGLLSDRLRLRCLPCVLSLLCASMTLYIFSSVGEAPLLIITMLVLNGIFINGPSALISSAISADLGAHPTLSKNDVAMATVAGIVDGTGALGTAIGQYGIAALSEKLDWAAVFYMLACLCIFSCLLLGRLLANDLYYLKARRYQASRRAA